MSAEALALSFTDHHVGRVDLGVSATNAPAITCYEKVGFTHGGTWPDAFVAGTSSIDVYWMTVTRDRWGRSPAPTTSVLPSGYLSPVRAYLPRPARLPQTFHNVLMIGWEPKRRAMSRILVVTRWCHCNHSFGFGKLAELTKRGDQVFIGWRMTWVFANQLP